MTICVRSSIYLIFESDTVIRTYAEDVTVGFTYTLHIVCQDASDMSNQILENSEQFTDIDFTSNTPCTATMSATTLTTITASTPTLETQMTPAGSGITQPSPSDLTPWSSPRLTSLTIKTSVSYSTGSIVSSAHSITLTDKQNAKGFFQEPLNIAIVSAVGGTGVLAAAGVLSVVMGSKLCHLLSKATR